MERQFRIGILELIYKTRKPRLGYKYFNDISLSKVKNALNIKMLVIVFQMTRVVFH